MIIPVHNHLLSISKQIIFLVIIENPKDCTIKYEFDHKSKKIKVDRILRDRFKYLTNYGFIETALDWDGGEFNVRIWLWWIK